MLSRVLLGLNQRGHSRAALIAGSIGAALGCFVPRLVHRWKLDPKIASGPAVLALTDIAALSCYVGLSAIFVA
jgi:Mg/Co/Ni transporter MgtE